MSLHADAHSPPSLVSLHADARSTSSLPPLSPHLQKIVSGGQDGADRAALLAAERLGFDTGGVAPPRYMTVNGPRPDLGSRFHLEELLGTFTSDTYVTRSMLNVDRADGTLAFRTHASPGTDKTIGYCTSGKWQYVPKEQWLFHVNQYRPLLVLESGFDCEASHDARYENARRLRRFLKCNRIRVLNVCGHRGARGSEWERCVTDFLVYALGATQ